MKCPKDNVELVHSSPSTKLGLKHKYTSLVYVCDVCHGVWIENPQVVALKQEQTVSDFVRAAEKSLLVKCPSCQLMVGALTDVGPEFPGVRLCPHCAAILRYETMRLGRRTI